MPAYPRRWSTPSSAPPVLSATACSAPCGRPSIAGGEAGPVHSAGMMLVREVAWPVAGSPRRLTEDCPITALGALWDIYRPQLDAYVPGPRPGRPRQATECPGTYERGRDTRQSPAAQRPAESGGCASPAPARILHRRRPDRQHHAPSERIHISQPSISTAIAHLERELSVQLFVRHHAQGLSLTPIGREVLRDGQGPRGAGRGPLHPGLRSRRAGAGAAGSGRLGNARANAGARTRPRLHHRLPGDPDPLRRGRSGTAHHRLAPLRNRSRPDYDLHVPNDIHFTPLVDLPPHVLVARGTRSDNGRRSAWPISSTSR